MGCKKPRVKIKSKLFRLYASIITIALTIAKRRNERKAMKRTEKI